MSRPRRPEPQSRASGIGVAGREESPGIPTVTVPPPAAATAASGLALATSSLTGGVVRKICCSNPAMTPPIVWPADAVFFRGFRGGSSFATLEV